MTKRNKWGQKSGGWSPFATSRPQANVEQVPLCDTCGGAKLYEAFDRAKGEWFTYICSDC